MANNRDIWNTATVAAVSIDLICLILLKIMSNGVVIVEFKFWRRICLTAFMFFVFLLPITIIYHDIWQWILSIDIIMVNLYTEHIR